MSSPRSAGPPAAEAACKNCTGSPAVTSPRQRSANMSWLPWNSGCANRHIGNRAYTMKIYAFDVDDTLEISGGPVSIVSVGSLKPQGHIVGLNGNWAVVVQTVPLWHRIFSFVGPMEMSKDTFLNQLKTYIPADDYVMVGNIKGVSGASDDEGAANLAGWRFIKESDFAAGAR